MASAPLLGSYELSLLASKTSALKVAQYPFLLVFSYPTPTRPTRTATVRIPFDASYHDLQSPWVATADLARSEPPTLSSDQAIQVAPMGQLTLIIQNEFNTSLRLLLFPYNLRHLPANSTVLLRRSWYVGQKLKYAVHVQFASFRPGTTRPNHLDDDSIFDIDDVPTVSHEGEHGRKKNIIFLFHEIRLVFAFSSPDQDEELRVQGQGHDNVFPWTHWPSRLRKRLNDTPRPVRNGRSSSLCAMSLPEDDILHPTP